MLLSTKKNPCTLHVPICPISTAFLLVLVPLLMHTKHTLFMYAPFNPFNRLPSADRLLQFACFMAVTSTSFRTGCSFERKNSCNNVLMLPGMAPLSSKKVVKACAETCKIHRWKAETCEKYMIVIPFSFWRILRQLLLRKYLILSERGSCFHSQLSQILFQNCHYYMIYIMVSILMQQWT